MPIRVVRFNHQHAYVLKEVEPTVLLFDPRLERGAEPSIGGRFRRIEAGARNADIVVIRGSHPGLFAEVEGDELLRSVAGSGRVVSLAPEEQHGPPVLKPPTWSQDPSLSLEFLREAELLCGIYDSSALFNESGFHYLLPSGRSHAAAFVRLADGLDDHIDLMRLSDWLVHRVDAQTALAADNGSLLALLTTIAMRVQARGDDPPPIATFDAYPHAPTEITDTLERFRARGSKRILFCVSVSSSGHVASQVNDLEIAETDVVILCETKPSADPPEPEPVDGIDRFCRVPIERWEVEPDGRCEECPSQYLLTIDPRHYEVRAQIRIQPTGLDYPNAIENRPLWEAADETDAVELHVQGQLAAGATEATRHLAVSLHVDRLLKNKWFRNQCIDALRRIEEPELFLIPNHDCVEALRALVKEAFPEIDEGDIRTCTLGRVSDALPELKEERKHVVLVDDTLVSGTTLVALHQELYAMTRPQGRGRVSAFVALSRPSTPEDLEHLERRLATEGDDGKLKINIGRGHHLLLPDGGECPWDEEEEQLGRHLPQLDGDARAFPAERRKSLKTGIHKGDRVALCGEQDHGKTYGSLFGDLSDVAAFAAASAVAQHMHCRFERERFGERINVLDVSLILQALFDPVIVGALLRTLQPRDLRDPRTDPLVARTIRENAKEYPDATIAELALAAMTGRVPAEPVKELLEGKDGGWAEAFRQILAGY